MRVELGPPVLHQARGPAEEPAATAAMRRGKLAGAANFGERWQEQYMQPALLRLAPLLHGLSRAALVELQAPPPGGLLICGAAGRYLQGKVSDRAVTMTYCR